VDASNSPLSEDDIRTKVVYTWLAGCGLSPSDIYLEYSFEIRLGRSTYRIGNPRAVVAPRRGSKAELVTVHPRTDVLVRRGEKNLLVVEVKRPDEALNDEARDQGISYARLLPEMAPFVVLTNGRQTKIFDTVTREPLEGKSIPPDHPTVRAGFRISGDDL
jgi:hypothetical protein